IVLLALQPTGSSYGGIGRFLYDYTLKLTYQKPHLHRLLFVQYSQILLCQVSFQIIRLGDSPRNKNQDWLSIYLSSRRHYGVACGNIVLGEGKKSVGRPMVYY